MRSADFSRNNIQDRTKWSMKIEKLIAYIFLTFILMVPASTSSARSPC
jgi:hypothetical protein